MERTDRYTARMLIDLRRDRFIVEFLKDLNATKAWVRAGYSTKGAGQNAARALRRPEVQAAIQARQAQLARQFEVTPAKIVEEFAKLAFSNIDDVIEVAPDGRVAVDLSKADRARRAAITQITIDEFEGPPGTGARARRTRIRLASKQRALEALGRHFGMFVDRSEVTLVDNLADDIAAARKRAWGGG